MDKLNIRVVEQDNDISIVRLAGSLDSFSASRLENIVSVLYGKGCRKMVVSCEYLCYISSVGLKVLLEIARRFNANSKTQPSLALCAVNSDIAGVLDLSGILHCVLLYDDISQARLNLSGKEV